MDDVYGDELHVPNVEDWPETGLPWIVFWLKELIVWGTLEPVAAYLLACGVEYTRPDAEEAAQQYYGEHPQYDDANEILNAVTVRDWVKSRSSRDIPSSVSGPPHQIQVKLLRDFSNVPKEQWRVVPVLVNDEIRWLDPAGFPLACCQKPNDWDSTYIDSYDFILDAAKEVVLSDLYV